MKRLLRPTVAILVASTFIFGGFSSARAEKPTVSRLLPETTLVYARIPSIPDLIEKMGDTGVGQMAQDPAITGLFGQLYGEAEMVFSENVEGELGLSLNQLVNLPQGELVVALVATEDDGVSTGGDNFAVVGFLDISDDEAFATLLGAGRAAAERDGGKVSSEAEGDFEIEFIQGPGDEGLAIVQREGTVCFSNNIDVLHEVLIRWDGIKIRGRRSLSENRKFKGIMNRCRGIGDETPQLILYADPMEIFRTSLRGQDLLTSTVPLSIASGLGVDGFLAVGGAMYMDVGHYESVTQMHVLLETPREGIVKMLALEGGETKPQPFVPLDVSNYMTANVNVEKAYNTLDEMLGTLNSNEAYLDERLADISQPTGVDFKGEVIDQLTGRVTWCTWVVPPAKINSQSNLFAIQVKDGKKMKETLDVLLSLAGNNGPIEDVLDGVTYYHIDVAGQQQRARDRAIEERKRAAERTGQDVPEIREPPGAAMVRTPSPAFAIIDDYVVASDSVEFLKHAISTINDGDKLADDEEFKTVQDEIRDLIGASQASGIAFSRPEESLKMIFDLANSDEARGLLSQAQERGNNPVMKILNGALNDNPLPDFEELSKFLAPSGGVFTNDETGFHYTAFGLRRE